MGNHPFNVVVILFWLATMSWLVVAKVLPPLRVGEPPSYRSMLDNSVRQRPVCWNIRLNDRSIGWAANKIERRAEDGVSEMHSRVYLENVPIEELAPGWLSKVLKPLLRDLGPLDVDKKSRIVIDPLGRLVGFESRLRIADIPDVIKVQGQVEGSSLKLTVQSGEIPQKLETYMPPNALMTDELSPQAMLPGLRVGQTWTVPLYSPFRPLNNPIEILQARVESEERITWCGQSINSRLVVYRSDPGSGLTNGESRGRMWVTDEGLVVRQEVTILRSRLQFLRLSDGQAEAVARAIGDDWNATMPNEVSKHLLRTVDAFSP